MGIVNIVLPFVGGVNIAWKKFRELRAYHHGDLRNALVEAAVAAAQVNGPEAVVVRDMARQVGVSHNAAYRHFASREDLLTAVAEVGLDGLGAAMRQELDATPRRRGAADKARQRLRAIGHAYVSFALAEPGLFRTIWAAAQYPSLPTQAERLRGHPRGPRRPTPT